MQELVEPLHGEEVDLRGQAEIGRPQSREISRGLPEGCPDRGVRKGDGGPGLAAHVLGKVQFLAPLAQRGRAETQDRCQPRPAGFL
jgi:hypothetical protein